MANTQRAITVMSGTKTTGTTNGSAFGLPSSTTAFYSVLNVTASSAPTTLDVKFQFQDPVSLQWIDLKGGTQANTVAHATVGAVGTSTAFLTVANGLTETANKAFSQAIPSTIRAVATVVGTSYTFTVSIIPQLQR